MKNFYIIANYEKEYVKEAEAAIRDYLTQRGAVCNGAGEQALGKVSSADVPEETECIITIGGDGTLIQAARNLAAFYNLLVASPTKLFCVFLISYSCFASI